MGNFSRIFLFLIILVPCNGRAESSVLPLLHFIHADDALFWQWYQSSSNSSSTNTNRLLTQTQYPLTKELLRKKNTKDKTTSNLPSQTQKYFLAFTTPSNGHVASVFGHLFLVKSDNQRKPPKSGKTYQYIANTGDTRGLELVTKGTKPFFEATLQTEKLFELSDNYLNKQNRNILYYEVACTDYGKYLFNLFIDEIKASKSKYSFQKNNCALFVHYAINLLSYKRDSRPIFKNKTFVSPQKVLKSAIAEGHVTFNSIERSTINYLKSLDVQDQTWKSLREDTTLFEPMILEGSLTVYQGQQYLSWLRRENLISNQEFIESLDSIGKAPGFVDSEPYEIFPINSTKTNRSTNVKFGLRNKYPFVEVKHIPFGLQSDNLNELYPDWNKIEFLSTSLTAIGFNDRWDTFIDEFCLLDLDYKSGNDNFDNRLGFQFGLKYTDNFYSPNMERLRRVYLNIAPQKEKKISKKVQIVTDIGVHINLTTDIENTLFAAPKLGGFIQYNNPSNSSATLGISYILLNHNHNDLLEFNSYYQNAKMGAFYFENRASIMNQKPLYSFALGVNF